MLVPKERLANNVVRAAPRHAVIRGDFRHRQDRGNGHEMPDNDDHEAAPKADMRNRVTESQEEDRSEDRAD